MHGHSLGGHGPQVSFPPPMHAQGVHKWLPAFQNPVNRDANCFPKYTYTRVFFFLWERLVFLCTIPIL